MNDSDKRSLRSYLDNVLEPTLKHDQKELNRWAEDEKVETGLALDLATKMRRWHDGRVSAFTFAINEFKDIFGEDLK